MTPNRHSSREIVESALLWGVGVVVPVLLMMLILIWG
jgi:hypothetical protein